MIRVKSPICNPFAVQNHLETIRTHGQEIGMHVDCQECKLDDFGTLSRIADPLPIATVHNPKVPDPKPKGFTYYSDSNHKYQKTVDDWLEIAKNGPDKIILNFHPSHWVHNVGTIEEALKHTCADVIRKVNREFDTNDVWRGRCRQS
jgi:hypothetical protein